MKRIRSIKEDGVVLIELALVAFVLLVMVFCAYEISYFIRISQLTRTYAYEAANIAFRECAFIPPYASDDTGAPPPTLGSRQDPNGRVISSIGEVSMQANASLNLAHYREIAASIRRDTNTCIERRLALLRANAAQTGSLIPNLTVIRLDWIATAAQIQQDLCPNTGPIDYLVTRPRPDPGAIPLDPPGTNRIATAGDSEFMGTPDSGLTGDAVEQMLKTIFHGADVGGNPTATGAGSWPSISGYYTISFHPENPDSFPLPCRRNYSRLQIWGGAINSINNRAPWVFYGVARMPYTRLFSLTNFIFPELTDIRSVVALY